MKLTIRRTSASKSRSHSNSGFIIADFLFSFVLVIGLGIIIFGLTFSLATIEVAQYIVWSSARNFAAANKDEWTAALQSKTKFTNLSQQFPLLTGQGATGSPWFILTDFLAGDLTVVDREFAAKVPGSDLTNIDPAGEQRQPWTGASAKITLKLFSGLQIPFLGKIVSKDEDISFPIRAFVIRSPSHNECKMFFNYENRFAKGIKTISDFSNMNNLLSPPTEGEESQAYVNQEDNGC